MCSPLKRLSCYGDGVAKYRPQSSKKCLTRIWKVKFREFSLWSLGAHCRITKREGSTCYCQQDLSILPLVLILFYTLSLLLEEDHFDDLLREPVDDGQGEPSGKHGQNNLNISGMRLGFITSDSYLTMGMWRSSSTASRRMSRGMFEIC